MCGEGCHFVEWVFGYTHISFLYKMRRAGVCLCWQIGSSLAGSSFCRGDFPFPKAGLSSTLSVPLGWVHAAFVCRWCSCGFL